MKLTKKKLLIIGAGLAQRTAILEAKALGYYVICTDGDRNAVGLKDADESYVIDVKDSQSHIELVQKNPIDGVLSVACEACMLTVGDVVETFGLIGPDRRQTANATDKYLMRSAFQQAGLKVPKFIKILNLSELEKARALKFPVVVKPTDCAGSRGVRKVNEFADIEPAFISSKEFSRKGEVIIEEYIEGLESSVEAIKYNGVFHLLSLSDKIRTPPPYLLDTAVIFPSRYGPDVQARISEVVRRGVFALGLDNTPIHAEVLVAKNEEPVIVEIAARGPGFKVFTDMIPYVVGFNYLREVIKMVMGEQAFFEPRQPLKSAAIKFFQGKEGVLKKVNGLDEVRSLHGVSEIELYVEIGDRIRNLTSGADRVGHVILHGDNLFQINLLLTGVDGLISLEME